MRRIISLEKSNDSPHDFRVYRGRDLNQSPVEEIFELAKIVYGLGALGTDILGKWFETDPNVFLLVRRGADLAGYLSCLPVAPEKFEECLDEEFDEKCIEIANAQTSEFCCFISSIAIHPRFQSSTPVSALLRLALLQDMIDMADCKSWSLAAQTLSSKGSGCMRSLGLVPIGITKSNWQIERAILERHELIHHQSRLREKFVDRWKIDSHADIYLGKYN